MQQGCIQSVIIQAVIRTKSDEVDDIEVKFGDGLLSGC